MFQKKHGKSVDWLHSTHKLGIEIELHKKIKIKNNAYSKKGLFLAGPLPTKNDFQVRLAILKASFFDRNEARESGPPMPSKTCLLSS